MKKTILIIILVILFLVIVFFGILMARNASIAKRLKAMPISEVDLANVSDGLYKGDFAYGGFKYEVEVTVTGHKIEDIKVLKNRNTFHAKRAEGVIEKVLKNQSLKVDAVSGATNTSIALLKAIENALTGQTQNLK
jgi:uncharacterized protein with FMN-binding domain